MSPRCATWTYGIALAMCLLLAPTASAATWLPSAPELWRTLTLRDYNTRTVVLGTACLGAAAGMIGSFLLLRKRALLGDALSHATLPGICIAFIVLTLMGRDGKSLPGLLAGATISGLLGVAAILFIRHFSRLKEDAALGIVLSTFFGVGVAVQKLINSMPTASAAGLDGFIYGKTASMVAADAQIIAIAALAIAILCALLFKELTLLCYDQGFAASQGWPVRALDLLLMAAVTAVTVIGLQAVGLILIIALLIIPPAAARFWTERLLPMFLISAFIGVASGVIGAMASALFAQMPAGAVIVLSAAACFTVSMFFGARRGILVRTARRLSLNRRIAEQHLLRSLYELLEGDQITETNKSQLSTRIVTFNALLDARSWNRRQLRRMVRRAEREGLVVMLPGEAGREQVRLTDLGLSEARRVVRNHRLWEMYLITHADIAPSHVDRDADAIEHVLGRPMVDKLEALLDAAQPVHVPLSPHPVR
jgi:manganese/zinc/iron transport system permease protein